MNVLRPFSTFCPPQVNESPDEGYHEEDTAGSEVL